MGGFDVKKSMFERRTADQTKRGGKSTAEYEVVHDHFDPFVKKLQYVLPPLASKFFSKRLISDFELSDANNNALPAYQRATHIVLSILSKIENDSNYYYELIDVLDGSGMKNIADDLASALDDKFKKLVATAQPLKKPSIPNIKTAGAIVSIPVFFPPPLPILNQISRT